LNSHCDDQIFMGVGSGGRGPWPTCIFIHDTDKVEVGLMAIFFGLVFSIAPPSWKFFSRRSCESRPLFSANILLLLIKINHQIVGVLGF